MLLCVLFAEAPIAVTNRWWDNRNCPDLTKASTDETSSLQIENVAGVFFILVGGIVIAAVVCLGEYFANAMIRASKLVSQVKFDFRLQNHNVICLCVLESG